MNVSFPGPDTAAAPSAIDHHVTTPQDAATAQAADSMDGSRLSVYGQIHQLKEQGQTLSQISVDLDLSISAVGTDLLINVPQIPAITQTTPASSEPSISLSV